MDLGRPSTDCHDKCTQYWGGVKAYHLLSGFSPDPLKFGEGKTSIFEDRPQLEAHNFETAQHVGKRISDISYSTNELQIGIKWGPLPQRIFLQPS